MNRVLPANRYDAAQTVLPSIKKWRSSLEVWPGFFRGIRFCVKISISTAPLVGRVFSAPWPPRRGAVRLAGPGCV